MIESITPTEPRPLAPGTDAAAPRVDPGATWAGPHEVATPATHGPALTMLGTAANSPGCADGSCALPTAAGPG
jgi:hypothetical protein